MAPFERLRSVPLFSDLPDEGLERICESVDQVRLEAGDTLFREGDDGHDGYVVVDGEVEVLKATGHRETLLAVRGPGEVIGEMALLREEPRMASVRARSGALLIRIPKAALDEMIDTSPALARAMLATLLGRWEETSKRLRHTDRMAQLGTLTAGVAHELNNPAAAVKRAAERLGSALSNYVRAAGEAQVDPAAVEEIVGAASSPSREPPTALERSDSEADIEAALDAKGVPDAWRHAPELVDVGLDRDAVERLLATSAENPVGAIEFAVAAVRMRALISTVSTGAERLSSIVGALRSYAYLDRAEVHEVDVVQGIEDSLLLLDHRLHDIDVIRGFPEPGPVIMGSGSELNQVWTNLIVNAADAVSGSEGAAIAIRVEQRRDEVVVEIEDNGPGIPAELQTKVFDPFFTTKPPGQGTGLGLQISQGIVVLDHRGSIVLQSRPGKTVFEVRLPADGPR